MNKKFLVFQIAVVCVLIVMLVFYMKARGSWSDTYIVAPMTSTTTLAVTTVNPAPLLNPSVSADVGKHYIINFLPLKGRFQDVQKKYGGNTYVYFVYLNNAAWVGINEKELFTAASTIKVPLAMTIYKMEEEGKLKTTDSYSLTDLDLDPNFGSLYRAGPDNAFMLEELIGIMLKYSDNTAMHALFHVLDMIGISDPLTDIYTAMGWDYTNLGEEPTYVDINLKTLSNMFLALYNAQYDSVSDSQKILTYLTQSSFNSQIVAGVPKSIAVAHKIGIAQDATFSDCGIIYAPNRPYIMCIGTHGLSETLSDRFMADISKATYDYVINN